MQHQPAALDAELETRLVFRRRRLQLKQHRPVDRLDINPAVLNGFEGVSKLEDLAGRIFRIGVGARRGIGS